MKKLTAGILASLIGLVSANSADAAVASKKYVDEGLATKQNVLKNDVNVVKDPTKSEGAFVTGISAVDGVVTVSYGDQAEVEAATAEKAGVTKLYTTTGQNVDGAMTQKATTDELNLKQVKLTSTGDNANVKVEGKEGDNVVTGVSAANGVVTVTTGYFDHSNTEYEGVKDVDIVADTDNDGLLEVYTEYYDAQNTADNTGEGWYVLMRKSNGLGGYEYSWENIDRDYSETQPAQPTQE